MDLPFVNRRRQQGLALLVMVFVLILGSAFFLVKQLNSSALRLNSTAKSNNVLVQAKDALIGFASANSNRPGAMPCPDLDNNGVAEDHEVPPLACNTPAKRIGRLPWKTLGLPDLRDASGERLWYALSENFRDATTADATNVVNSDTPGTLNLNGNPPPSSPYTATALANSVVAIVFAPGAALSGQNRDPANSAAVTSVSNYLEGANGDVANDDVFVSALASDTFNDTLLAISHEDLFAVVDNVVRKKIETDLKPFLASYAAPPDGTGCATGYYPLAVPFTTPSTLPDDYKGGNSTYGLLPVTNDPNFLNWASPVLQFTVNVGTGTGNLASTCTTSSSPSVKITCNINYSRTGGIGPYTPQFKVNATLQNVGRAFVDLTQITVPASAITLALTSGSTLNMIKPTLSTKTMGSDGHMDLLFINGQLRPANTTTPNRAATLTITWPLPTTALYCWKYRPTAPSNPNLDWYFDNHWYQLTYYAIASGWGPAQYPAGPLLQGSCTAPACLTVNNLVPNNDKGAILVFFGRAGKKADGSDQTRPSSAPTDYLEGENLTPSDSTFESSPRSAIFNDKIIVLTP